MGAHTTFKPELGDEIVKRLSEGEPLRAICRDEHMPSWRTFYDWVKADAEFATRIAHARDLGYDALAEQCLDISDDETFDWLLTKKGVITNETAIGRAKLQVDTRLKLLAKWNPKRYGDKQAIEHSGELTVVGLSDKMRKRAPLA